MNPEALRRLMQTIQQARSQGRSDREINSLLRRNDNIPFNSIYTAETEAQAAGLLSPEGELRELENDEARVEDYLRRAGQGLTLGFGDELAGLVGGLATAPGEGTFSEGFQSAQEHAEGQIAESERRASGLLGAAADIGGGLLPLIGAGPAAFRAVGRIPEAVRGGVRALRSGVAREAAEQVAREVPSIIRPGMRGAAEGTVVGGATGTAEVVGRAEGGLDERLQALEEQSAIPLGTALFGGAIGTLGRGIPAIRRRIRAPEESGEVLAGALREQGGVAGRASRVERQIGRRKQAAREQLIRPLEQRGREIPLEVTETVLDNPQLREVARARAPRVVETAEAVARGERGSSIPLSAEEALSIRRGVAERASAFRRAARGDAPNVDPLEVQKAEDALEELNSVMEERLEGFPEFQQAWAREKQTGRALITGRKVANKPADDIAALWRGDPPADESLKSVFPNGLPADQQVRDAFREGLATEMIANLEEGQAGVRSFIDKARTGSQTREKLKIVLGGSEQRLNNFLDAVEAEQRIMNRAEMTKEIVKAAGFLGLGTSLFGGAALDVLF